MWSMHIQREVHRETHRIIYHMNETYGACSFTFSHSGVHSLRSLFSALVARALRSSERYYGSSTCALKIVSCKCAELSFSSLTCRLILSTPVYCMRQWFVFAAVPRCGMWELIWCGRQTFITRTRRSPHTHANQILKPINKQWKCVYNISLLLIRILYVD